MKWNDRPMGPRARAAAIEQGAASLTAKRAEIQRLQREIWKLEGEVLRLECDFHDLERYHTYYNYEEQLMRTFAGDLETNGHLSEDPTGDHEFLFKGYRVYPSPEHPDHWHAAWLGDFDEAYDLGLPLQFRNWSKDMIIHYIDKAISHVVHYPLLPYNRHQG